MAFGILQWQEALYWEMHGFRHRVFCLIFGSGRLSLEKVLVPNLESLCFLSLPSPDSATMGTTAPGPIHLLDLCDQKLLDFVCNMDNKDLMWLKEIEEEAERMFVR